MADRKAGEVTVNDNVVVTVHENDRGHVSVIVSDVSRDLMAVARLTGLDKAALTSTLRHNLSLRPNGSLASSTISIPAPLVSPDTLDSLRRHHGLKPIKRYITVAVAFKEFDSPAEAAAYGTDWVLHYQADAALKLTVGDRVRVPYGYKNEERKATVVALNTICPVDYIKRVIGRV